MDNDMKELISAAIELSQKEPQIVDITDPGLVCRNCARANDITHLCHIEAYPKGENVQLCVSDMTNYYFGDPEVNPITYKPVYCLRCDVHLGRYITLVPDELFDKYPFSIERYYIHMTNLLYYDFEHFYWPEETLRVFNFDAAPIIYPPVYDEGPEDYFNPYKIRSPASEDYDGIIDDDDDGSPPTGIESGVIVDPNAADPDPPLESSDEEALALWNSYVSDQPAAVQENAAPPTSLPGSPLIGNYVSDAPQPVGNEVGGLQSNGGDDNFPAAPPTSLPGSPLIAPPGGNEDEVGNTVGAPAPPPSGV